MPYQSFFSGGQAYSPRAPQPAPAKTSSGYQSFFGADTIQAPSKEELRKIREKQAKESSRRRQLEKRNKPEEKSPLENALGVIEAIRTATPAGRAAESSARAIARPVKDVVTGQGGKAVHDTAQLSSDIFGGGPATMARGVKNIPKAIAGEIASMSKNPYVRREGIKSVEAARKDTFQGDYKKGDKAMLKNLAGALAQTELDVGGGAVIRGIGKGVAAIRGGSKALPALEGATAARASRVANAGENAGKQALRGSQRITDPGRMLGTGTERISKLIDDLEKEKQSILKDPNAYSSNPESLASMKGEPAANVKLTKSGEVSQRGTGKRAGVFAEDRPSTVASASDSATRLREIHVEQRKLAAQLEAHSRPTTSIAPEGKPVIENPKGTPKPPTDEHIVEGVKDFADTKRGKLTNSLISTTGLLSRHGKEGQEAAKRVFDYTHKTRTLATDWSAKIPTVFKLKKGESDNFAKAVQGLEDARSAKVAKAVEEWKTLSPEIRQGFIAHTGEEIGNVENFFPRQVKREFLKGNGFNKAVDHLVKSGQVKTRGEAVRALEFAKKSSLKGNVLGSFKFHRNFDLPPEMYDTSTTAIANYLEGAAHSTAAAEHLGMDKAGTYHVADALIGDVAARGGDAKRMQKAFIAAMGMTEHAGGEGLQKLSNAARAFNVFTKLGRGAITNLGQTANTVIKNGFIDTAKGLGYYMTPAGRAYARETGAFTHGLVNELREASGINKGLSGKIGAPFFQDVEKFNRHLAASAGKFHAERLARRAEGKGLGSVSSKARSEAGKELTKLQAGGERAGGKLSKEQLRMAGRMSSDITQFEVAPHTLPGWASSPMGKMVAQFRTFSYKQTDFVANEILKPMADGNFAPFMRLLAVLPAGYGLSEVKNKLGSIGDPNPHVDDSKAQKVINAYHAVGGGGLPESEAYNVYTNRKYSYSDPYKEVLGNIKNEAGPTAGSLVDLGTATSSATHGKTKDLKKQGLKMLPVVGPSVSKREAPSGSDAGRHIKVEAPEVSKELSKINYRVKDTGREKGRAARLSDEDYKKYNETSTKVFAIRAKKALKDDRYKRLSDEDKKKQLAAILTGARTDVMNTLLGKPKRGRTARFSAYR